MYDNPIVAETRRLRDEYARQFGYDLNAICKDLRQRQQRGDRRIVRRQPNRSSDLHATPDVTESRDVAES